MIAFANADGGDMVVGITDGKREIEGVDGDEKILNEFVALHLTSVRHQ